jgi:uncharacterized protein (TIGR02266 family)
MRSEETARDSWSDEAPTALLERRSSGRVALEVEVTLTSDSQFFAGLTGDVSQGGLFVQTYKRYEVGCRVVVAFSLPGGEIRTAGIVRWIRPASDGTPPGFGIAFEGLSSAERASIDAFCCARPPLYHDVDDG